MEDIDNLYYDAMELLDGGRNGAKEAEKMLIMKQLKNFQNGRKKCCGAIWTIERI